MNINLTLLGEFITFAIFIWVTMKYIWPPMMAAIAERQKKIADGLAAAEQGKQNLDLAQSKSAKMIQDAKQEAAHIIDNANNRANRMIDEAKELARQEGQRLLDAAHNEIDLQKKQALRELEKTVADLSAAVASKIVHREIDAKAHQDILNQVLLEI